MNEVKEVVKPVDVAEGATQPLTAQGEVLEPLNPTEPSDHPSSRVQVLSDHIPISEPDLPNPHPSIDSKTPRQSTDGVEKNDWEVVNASPSHSPSKDADNQTQSTKGKGREREKSANSTFGKDGKIGQKIDGVKKVLKSGVFGNPSPKSPPARTKVTTKPPVPSARPTPAKPAGRASMAASTASTATKPSSVLGRSTTIPKPTSTVPTPRPGTVPSATGTVKPRSTSNTTTTDKLPADRKSSIGAKPTTTAPRPSGARASTASITTIRPSPPYTIRSARSESISKPTAASARRASIVSRGSNASADGTTATVTKPRSSMPMAKASSTGAKGSMLPPVIPNRAMPPRVSVGPGTFNHKEGEELKKKVAELEKELAAMKASQAKSSEKQQEEKTALMESHTRALAALSVEIQGAEEKAKVGLERQLGELQELRHRERGEMQHAHTTASKDMDTKLEEYLRNIFSLKEELAASQSIAEVHQNELHATQESESTYRRELDERRSQIGELIQSVADLRQSLADKETEIQVANEQLATLKQTGASSSAEIEDLQSSVSRLTLELDSAQEDKANDAQHQQRVETLEHEAQQLADELQKLNSQLDVMKVDLQTRTEEFEASQATIATMKEASSKQDTIIANLEKHRDDAQKKHDELLLEAAQMSDTRISELSDERDRLTSVKNELAAELAEERARSVAGDGKIEAYAKERGEAMNQVKELQQVIQKLQTEMMEAKVDHENKYASALADAREAATTEHNEEIRLLQAELASTHTELLASHKSELERLEESHKTSLADLRLEHQHKTDDVTQKLKDLEAQVVAGKEERQLLKDSLEKAESTSERLEKDLKAAVARPRSDSDAKEQLAKAFRHNAELMDELEGTKTMAEMNKSQFEELRQSSEIEHAAALQQARETFAADMAEERASRVSRIDGLQTELYRCRQDLDVARAEKSDVEHERRNINDQFKELKHQLSSKEETPHAGTFRAELPAESGPESSSPLADKEIAK